jgi:hypothetical protein
MHFKINAHIFFNFSIFLLFIYLFLLLVLSYNLCERKIENADIVHKPFVYTNLMRSNRE